MLFTLTQIAETSRVYRSLHIHTQVHKLEGFLVQNGIRAVTFILRLRFLEVQVIRIPIDGLAKSNCTLSKCFVTYCRPRAFCSDFDGVINNSGEESRLGSENSVLGPKGLHRSFREVYAQYYTLLKLFLRKGWCNADVDAIS